ncbi:MAG: M14 family zinc carboxypeptidase, partial [Planctomycetota bacterium]
MRVTSLLVLFLSLFLLASPSLALADDVFHLVIVKAVTEAEVRSIASLGVDIVQVNREGMLEIVATDSDIQEIRSMGFSVEVKIEDMAAYYAERLTVPAGHRGFPDGSMGGNYTLSEIEAMLDAWAVQYPNLITAKQSIGTTIQGRNIWAVKISDNPN